LTFQLFNDAKTKKFSDFLILFTERLDEFWPENNYLTDLLRSTGLYAKAGTIVEVTVAKDLFDKIKVI
jgi:hypothetical protein